MMQESKFNFWLPIEISKAKNKDGVQVMKISGRASTADKDLDGEELDVNGYDISKFKNGGLVNWHHQTKNDPLSIIGLVKDAEIKKDGLYIDTELFPDSEMAKKVYKLAATMEKAGRPLGFSIEGKAIERDVLNPKKITKSLLTGVAITFAPKNPSTFAQIVKGEVDGSEEMEFDDEDLEKDFTTEDGKPITPSDLGKKKSKKDKSKTTTSTKENGEVSKYLSKSEVFERIFSSLGGITIADSQKVFDFIKGNITEQEMDNQYKETDIEKALTLLSKANDLIKGDNASEEEEESEEVTDEATEEESTDDESALEKALNTTEPIVAAVKPADTLSKSQVITSLIKKGFSPDEARNICVSIEKAHNPEIVKGEESELLSTSDLDISKALEEGLAKQNEMFVQRDHSIGVIMKGVYDEVRTIAGDLKKAKDENEILKGVINGLAENIDSLSKAMDVPNAPKAITNVKPVERQFEGNTDITKGQVSNDFGTKILSMSAHKKTILNLLDNSTFEKGFDSDFAEALRTVEAGGLPQEAIVLRLQKEKGITITK
jgi:SOS response regulatory protein OraA/RecX